MAPKTTFTRWQVVLQPSQKWRSARNYQLVSSSSRPVATWACSTSQDDPGRKKVQPTYSTSESVLVQYCLQHCFQHLIGQSVQKTSVNAAGRDSFSQSNVQLCLNPAAGNFGVGGAPQRETTGKYGLRPEKGRICAAYGNVPARPKSRHLAVFAHLLIDTWAAKD